VHVGLVALGRTGFTSGFKVLTSNGLLGARVIYGTAVINAPPRYPFLHRSCAIAGLVDRIWVVWLAYGYIYRWSRTRLSDKEIDAALTLFAWPASMLCRGRHELCRAARRPPRSLASRIVEVIRHD